jgi:hypothetical protein
MRGIEQASTGRRPLAPLPPIADATGRCNLSLDYRTQLRHNCAVEEVAMPDWSVMIVPANGTPGVDAAFRPGFDGIVPANGTPGVDAAFQPDIDGAKPGQPLRVVQFDNVSWNNTTDTPRWPWLLSGPDAAPGDSPPNDVFLTPTPIQPGTPSPIFTVTADTGTTLFYCDKLNPAVRAQIVVVPFGT